MIREMTGAYGGIRRKNTWDCLLAIEGPAFYLHAIVAATLQLFYWILRCELCLSFSLYLSLGHRRWGFFHFVVFLLRPLHTALLWLVGCLLLVYLPCSWHATPHHLITTSTTSNSIIISTSFPLFSLSPTLDHDLDRSRW